MPTTNQARSRGATPSSDRNWQNRSIGLLGFLTISLVACFLYLPTLRYEMIFDDYPCIIENESLHQLTPLFGSEGGYGPLNPQPGTPLSARPLVSVTLALNYYFGQTDPFGYRLVHLILHVAVGLILWSILANTLRQPCFQNRFAEYHQPIALAAALVWLVHPTHADSVVYLTQRTELMMGFFYALTVLVAIRFWQANSLIARIAWCVGAFVTSSCGMLSKEMMASVPAMILVYEWTFVGGSPAAMAKRSWMLYVALVLSWIPLWMIYSFGYSTPLGGFNNLVSAHDWWLTQSNSFFVYWRLLFNPWPLLIHYHVPVLNEFAVAWPGVLGLAAYAVLTTYLLWRRSPAGFALLWFFAVLSPTLIIPLPHEAISERRLYVPLLAMLPFLSIAAFTFLQNRFPREGKPLFARLLGHAPSILAIICLATISIISVPRLSKRSEIWREVLKHQPHNMFAIASQGCVEFNRGELESGIEKMQLAFDSDPAYPFFGHTLLNSLKRTQQFDRLLDCCLQMSSQSPNDPTCIHNLAIAYEKNEMIEDAIREYEKSVDVAPKNWESHSALATLLAETNRFPEAIQHFEVATQLKPDFMNCMNLAGLYIHSGQNKKAMHTTELLLQAARDEKQPQDVIDQVEQRLHQLKQSQESPAGSRQP